MGDLQPLSTADLRVLGSLMEKEILTPDLYPLSLNALQAACNQRSSRDPVLDLAETDILHALDTLEHRGLVARARPGLGSANPRVPKFENHARTALVLRRDEFAILCLLLLRGPQTPGELRSRADRLFSFPDLDTVTTALHRLSAAASAPDSPSPRPLVVQLPRQPGAREARFAHLLGDPPSGASHPLPDSVPHTDSAPPLARLAAQLQQLEATVQELAHRIADLEHTSSRLSVPLPSGPAHSETPVSPEP